MVAALVHDGEVSSAGLVLRQQILLDEHRLPVEKEEFFISVAYLNADLTIGRQSQGLAVPGDMSKRNGQAQQLRQKQLWVDRMDHPYRLHIRKLPVRANHPTRNRIQLSIGKIPGHLAHLPPSRT